MSREAHKNICFGDTRAIKGGRERARERGREGGGEREREREHAHSSMTAISGQ